MPSTISGKIRTFVGLPAFVKLWAIPVWFMLGLARLAVLVIPMRFLARFMGAAAGLAARLPIVTVQQHARALLISNVIKLAARYAPWNANCFAQALTARFLLGVYDVPYAIFFGLMRDPSSREMKAHAWVGAGPVRVTGGDGFSQFTVVATYMFPACGDIMG